MNDVLSNIGENTVILLLSYITYGKGWEASKVISEGGYDVLLSKISGKKRIRIEVKTRQEIFTSQKRIPNYVAFDLTLNEWNYCDFLIGYWWDESAFFIVPQENLTPVNKRRNGPVTIYRYIAKRKRRGTLIEDIYLNSWDLLKKALR